MRYEYLRLPRIVKDAFSSKRLSALSPKRLSGLRKDTFYSNSLYLTLSRLITSAAGLIFWIIAAKAYSQNDVGVATAIISTTALVSSIALLGTGQSIIRYFPTHDRSKVLGTSLRITAYFSVLIGFLFLFATSWWAPELDLNASDAFIFIILACATTMIFTTGFAFTAGRNAKHTFIQNLVWGSRVLFLLPLVLFGALGIVLSMTLGSILAIVYSVFIIAKLGMKVERIDWSYLRQSVWFSAGNYVSTLLMTLPTLAMPLVIFGRLGADDAAVYYMASSVSYAAAVIPNSTTDSLFVEGSHGEHFWKNAFKCLKTSFLILIPVSIVLYLFGGWVLQILGSSYATGGTEVLRLMVYSIFFFTFVMVILAWARVQKNMKVLVSLSVVTCILTIGLSYILVGQLDSVNGVGYAFIISYGISALVGAAMIVVSRWRLRTRNIQPVGE